MKRYLFKNPQSCLKFLAYLSVKVTIPNPKSVFTFSNQHQEVLYYVETEGFQCVRAYMELKSSNNQVKPYVFYHSLSKQEADSLNRTIYRLRQAYQQIQINKEE